MLIRTFTINVLKSNVKVQQLNLSTNIVVLMLVYGIIGGFGFGMIYLPAVVIVGYYFESKRSLATGIAVCGSGMGSLALPPLANYIMSYFGSWTSVVLAFGLLCFSCTGFGCLMKPLNLEEENDDDEKNDNNKKGTSTKDMFNWKLLTNPNLVLLCLCHGLGNLGTFVPYFFLPNMANLRGITKENSDYLLSVIGIGLFNKYKYVGRHIGSNF